MLAGRLTGLELAIEVQVGVWDDTEGENLVAVLVGAPLAVGALVVGLLLSGLRRLRLQVILAELALGSLAVSTAFSTAASSSCCCFIAATYALRNPHLDPSPS